MKCTNAIARYCLFCLALALSAIPVQAGLITKGEATMTIDIAAMSTPPGLLAFERFYGALGDEASTLTRNQMVSPGGAPFPGSPTSANDLVHPVNGMVTSPTGGGIRYRQSTTLDYDASDVLGSWSESTWNVVKILDDGEQIGLDGVLRLNFDPGLGGGVFLLGDYALRYAPSRPTPGSGLVVVNNFDYPNSPLFDIGNAVISATPNVLSITGDLLLSPEYVFFFGGVDFADVGDFRMTAAVPEPSSIVLALTGVAGLVAVMRGRRPGRQ